MAPPLLVAGDVVGGAAAAPPKLVLLAAEVTVTGRCSWRCPHLTLGAGTLRYWKKAAVSAWSRDTLANTSAWILGSCGWAGAGAGPDTGKCLHGL